MRWSQFGTPVTRLLIAAALIVGGGGTALAAFQTTQAPPAPDSGIGVELRTPGPGAVYRIPIEGVIELGLAPFVERVLREAAAADAAVVILEVETPGGRVDAAERIADAFSRHLAPPAGASDDRYRYRPCHRIVLDLEHCEQTPPWDGIPRHARVVAGRDHTSSYTLSLFRAHDGSDAWTWGDLVDEVDGAHSPWLRDLDQAFVHSLEGHLWRPSMELMEVWQPDAAHRRTYRPIIDEVVRRASDDAPVEITILLVPDDSAALR